MRGISHAVFKITSTGNLPTYFDFFGDVARARVKVSFAYSLPFSDITSSLAKAGDFQEGYLDCDIHLWIFFLVLNCDVEQS